VIPPTPRRSPPGPGASRATCCRTRCAAGAPSAALAGALEDLSPQQRDAVRLRVVDELAYPVVAARLGITEQAARARVSRALRVLAVALEPAR
jgi:DNA-directed RNA polymerase specialized sigma24 family protein